MTKGRGAGDAYAAWYARRCLDGGIADGNVAPESRVRRSGENNDPITVAQCGVLFDQVVVAVLDADAEVVVWSREAVSRRLVPTERVVTALDSYASTGEARLSAAVSNGQVGGDRDSGGSRVDQDAGLTVRGDGDIVDPAEQRSREEHAHRAKVPHDAGPTYFDVGLTVRADAVLSGLRRAIASRCGIGQAGYREPVETQTDMRSAEGDRGNGHSAGDVADERLSSRIVRVVAMIQRSSAIATAGEDMSAATRHSPDHVFIRMVSLLNERVSLVVIGSCSPARDGWGRTATGSARRSMLSAELRRGS